MGTLHDFIERIHLEAQNDDSIIRGKKRIWIKDYAIEGLGELNMTFANHVLGMNVQIGASCKIYKPQGYVDFLRAYLINCDGKTIELKRNNKIPAEIYGYLTQCDGTLMGDDCIGDIRTECYGCNEPVKLYHGCKPCQKCGCDNLHHITPEQRELLYNLDRYKDSWIRAKNDVDYFEFSADLEDMWVMIECFVDKDVDADECQINVDVNLAKTLEYYVKYRLLEGGQDTISMSQFFEKKYKTAKKKASINDNALTKTDLFAILTMK